MTQPSQATTPFKVIQVCSVAPLHEPTPSSTVVPTSLPLTFFDLLWLRFPPVERLFFYSFPHPTTSFLHSLQHSLSLTLHHFLPFAGTLTWPPHSPKPVINYLPGDAVSFTVAESNEDFNDLISHLCEAPKRHRLIPHLTTSHDKTSVLALQVTVFPNAGFCIAITTHHAAFDGKSSTLFIKSWAHICSNLQNQNQSNTPISLPQHLTPFFDRSVIRDPSGFAEANADAWRDIGGSQNNNQSLKLRESFETPSDGLKGVFELTPSQIQKLKQHAKMKKRKDDDLQLSLSTFAVTCAYVLTCLVKAKQPKEDSVSFVFAVDCRTRLDPPVPATYVGNCVVGQKITALTKNLEGSGEEGFISALEGVSEGLNRAKSEGVLSGAENWVSKLKHKREGRLFSTAGSPWFEVYGTDFGWGRPRKVDMSSTDGTGAFSLSESRDNSGGIEIGLMLSKPEMEDFTTLFVGELESF